MLNLEGRPSFYVRATPITPCTWASLTISHIQDGVQKISPSSPINTIKYLAAKYPKKKGIEIEPIIMIDKQKTRYIDALTLHCLVRHSYRLTLVRWFIQNLVYKQLSAIVGTALKTRKDTSNRYILKLTPNSVLISYHVDLGSPLSYYQ